MGRERIFERGMMVNHYLIYKTHDPETGQPLKEYYTQNPIPEGTTFEVQYGGQTLQFRMGCHWLSNETVSVIELVSVSSGVKRPRLGDVK